MSTTNKNYVGEYIIHHNTGSLQEGFGKGKITKQTKYIIEVTFLNGAVKKFRFPLDFNRVLQFENSKLQTEIKPYAENADQEERKEKEEREAYQKEKIEKQERFSEELRKKSADSKKKDDGYYYKSHQISAEFRERQRILEEQENQKKFQAEYLLPNTLTIQQIIQSRNIRKLLHFTNVNNLPSIIKYGLLSRCKLQQKGISFDFNDDKRLDFCENAICTSVEFPNYKMFYAVRQTDEKISSQWVVISIDPKILLKKSCIFCKTNAASGLMLGRSVQERMRPQAFEGMFLDELDLEKSRSLRKIPDNYPTDPQAEILVPDGIPLEYIQDFYFEDEKTLYNFKKYLPKGTGRLCSQYFRPRIDYEFDAKKKSEEEEIPWPTDPFSF